MEAEKHGRRVERECCSIRGSYQKGVIIAAQAEGEREARRRLGSAMVWYGAVTLGRLGQRPYGGMRIQLCGLIVTYSFIDPHS